MPDYSVESVRRAVRILNAIGSHRSAATLSEIVDQVQLTKATVFRLLSTLVLEGMVEQDPQTHQYKLGVNTIALGQKALDSTDLVGVAKPYLEKVTDRYPVVAYLNVLIDTSVLTIDRVPHLAGVQFIRAGAQMPLHATASGLVFLAFCESTLLSAVVSRGLEKVASGTISDPGVLRAAVEEVRNRGYAYDRSTLDEGVGSVAAPVRDHRENVIATIGLSGAITALDEIGWPELATEVLRVANNVSSRLGSGA